MLVRSCKQLLLIDILNHDELDVGCIRQEHYGKFYATKYWVRSSKMSSSPKIARKLQSEIMPLADGKKVSARPYPRPNTKGRAKKFNWKNPTNSTTPSFSL